jgi:hypothetical protein
MLMVVSQNERLELDYHKTWGFKSFLENIKNT